MTTLLSADDTFPLFALITAGTAISIWLEHRYRWAARLSAPVLALIIAMALSNLRVMPPASPAYDFVGDYLVPLALPLLLFRANVVRIARATGRLFLAFHISSVGTVLGAVLACFTLHGRVPAAEYAAAIETGSDIGGMINFIAIKETYRVSEAVTNPLLVADNFIMAVLFVVLISFSTSAFFRRHYPHPHSKEESADSAAQAAAHWQRKGIGLQDIARAIGVSFTIVAVALLIGRLTGAWITVSPDSGWPVRVAQVLLTNKYVLITGVSLAAATFLHRPLAAINGTDELGSYLLYLFLFTIGLPADLKSVLFNVPMFFVFCTIIVGTNLVFTLIVGKLCRCHLEDLLIAVNANVGGPASAAAMAISKGWPRLVLPAILAGIWGYVIGTPIGIVVAELLIR